MVRFADFLSSDDDDVLLREDSFQCKSVLSLSLSLYVCVHCVSVCASVCVSMLCLCIWL